MTWKYIDFEGQRYDLSHLQDFQFEVVRPPSDKGAGWSIKIDVTFSWHCYTRAPGKTETVKIQTQGKEQRCFCPVRFEHSKRLPEIIQDLSERKILQTGKGNYITIEVVDHDGKVIDYEIYFDLRKQGRKQPLKLVVESAYLREPSAETTRQKRKRQPIRFRVLVHNTHHGKKIRYKR